MPYNPPFLEDQCFLYLLCRLEEYPVEVLSLLPVRMRHKLLCNLPVVDVCELEKFPEFVQGVKMEDVWKIIFNKRQPAGVGIEDIKDSEDRELDEAESPHNEVPWKEHYFRIVTGLALNYINAVVPHAHLKFLMDLLFFVEDCLGITGWSQDFSLMYFNCDEGKLSGGVLNSGRFAPFRFSEYMHDQVKTTDLVKLIVERCCIYPTVLHIICDYFIASDLWRSREEHKALIKKLVSQVQVVKLLYEDGVPHESVNVPFFLLDTILSCEEPRLRSLVINDCNSRAMEDIILSIAEMLAETEGTHSAERSSCSAAPYNRLHHLMLSIKSRPHERRISTGVAEKLSQIIQYQESLTSLSLCCWNPYHKRKPPKGFFQLYSSLSGLLVQPHFDTLGLGGFTMPFHAVQELFHSFLTNMPTRTQGMVIGALELSDSESPGEHSAQIVMPEESIHYKCLCLLEMNTPKPLSEWLFSCRKLRFKVFETNAVDMLEPQTDIFHLVAQHPDFEAESLHFCNTDINNNSTTERAFETILQKSQLKRLSLKNCVLGLAGNLPHLARGLQKQAAVGTLEYLDLSESSIGEQPIISISEVEMLFDAIFSLPQLECFALVIADNFLDPEHFTMLHAAWRQKAGGKKLKHLDCSSNVTPEDTSDLHEMTDCLVL